MPPAWRFSLAQKQSVPPLASSHFPCPRSSTVRCIRLTAYGGAGVGEIRLEDDSGKEVREDDIDPAPVFGLRFTASF